MNQFHSWLVPQSIVFLGALIGLTLLVCSLVKNNINCNRLATVTLLLTCVLMYPLLWKEESHFLIFTLNYQYAFMYLLLGTILSFIAFQVNNSFQNPPVIISGFGILIALIGFNIISINLAEFHQFPVQNKALLLSRNEMSTLSR